MKKTLIMMSVITLVLVGITQSVFANKDLDNNEGLDNYYNDIAKVIPGETITFIKNEVTLLETYNDQEEALMNFYKDIKFFFDKAKTDYGLPDLTTESANTYFDSFLDLIQDMYDDLDATQRSITSDDQLVIDFSEKLAQFKDIYENVEENSIIKTLVEEYNHKTRNENPQTLSPEYEDIQVLLDEIIGRLPNFNPIVQEYQAIKK